MEIEKYDQPFHWDIPEVAVAICKALGMAGFRPDHGKMFPEEVEDVEVKVQKGARPQVTFEMKAIRGSDQIYMKFVSGGSDQIQLWGGSAKKKTFMGTFPAKKLADANEFFEIMLRSDLRLE